MSANKFYYREVTTRMGIEVTFVDFTVLENVEKEIKANTKVDITPIHISK